MSNQIIYRIKVDGPGLSLERDVSEDIGKQVVVLVLTNRVEGTPPGPDERVPELSDRPARKDASADDKPGGAQPSVREHLNETGAKRSPDKITAFGCFLRDVRNQSTFSRGNIKSMFEEAAETVPKNLGRDIKWAQKIGWIAEKSGSKGVFYVTNSGMDAVQQRFPKELTKKTTLPTSRAKRSAKGEASKDR